MHLKKNIFSSTCLFSTGESDVVFVESSRGYINIQMGHYRYCEHSNNRHRRGPQKRWTCVSKTTGCKATIITVDNYVVKTMNTHNH